MALGAGIAVLHWFSGTQRDLTRAVDLGCWFSVGPTMLGSDKGRALAARMPRDRVLTESDGPFAQVEGRPAFPWDVEQAVYALAEVWAEPLSTVRDRLMANFRRLVSQPSEPDSD
jgi:TatD DNase family protein